MRKFEHKIDVIINSFKQNYEKVLSARLISKKKCKNKQTNTHTHTQTQGQAQAHRQLLINYSASDILDQLLRYKSEKEKQKENENQNTTMDESQNNDTNK